MANVVSFIASMFWCAASTSVVNGANVCDGTALSEAWSLFQTDPEDPHYSCNSSRYEAILGNLPALNIQSLLPPKDATILFYGHSFLQELLVAVVSAGKHCGKGSFAILDPCHSLNITSACLHPPPKPINPLGVYSFSNGAKIVIVRNLGFFQRRNADAKVAREVLLNHFKFDVALYMTPHADCFFDHQENPKRYPKWCIDLGSPGSVTKADMAVWQQIHAKAGRAFQIMPWTRGVLAKGVLANRSSEVVQLGPLVRQYGFCKVPNCKDEGLGHQCLPGPLTLVARKVMQLVFGDN